MSAEQTPSQRLAEAHAERRARRAQAGNDEADLEVGLESWRNLPPGAMARLRRLHEQRRARLGGPGQP